MKKLTIAFCLLLPVLIFAQDEIYSSSKEKRKSDFSDEFVKQLRFPEQIDTIVILEGLSKSEIYLRAKEWANRTFNNQKNVLQTDDKEGGLITYKYLDKWKFNLQYGRIIYFYQQWNILASIYIKEGKVRFVLGDFRIEQDVSFLKLSEDSFGGRAIGIEYLKEDVRNELRSIKKERSKIFNEIYKDALIKTHDMYDNLQLMLDDFGKSVAKPISNFDF